MTLQKHPSTGCLSPLCQSSLSPPPQPRCQLPPRAVPGSVKRQCWLPLVKGRQRGGWRDIRRPGLGATHSVTVCPCVRHQVRNHSGPQPRCHHHPPTGGPSSLSKAGSLPEPTLPQRGRGRVGVPSRPVAMSVCRGGSLNPCIPPVSPRGAHPGQRLCPAASLHAPGVRQPAHQPHAHLRRRHLHLFGHQLSGGRRSLG